MLDSFTASLVSLRPLVVDRTIYVPSWETTEDEICELTGLDSELIERVGNYFVIDVPEDLE